MTETLPPTGRSLPIALMRARERVMAPIREMLQASGITEQQWRVLRVLSEHGAMDGARLAERASLLPSSVTRITRSMMIRGHLSRTTDSEDRRRQTLEITGLGQKVIDDNLPAATTIVAGFKNQLGDADYEQLLDLLERLDRS